MYLIGTKSDLEGERQVNTDLASDFAYNYQILFSEVNLGNVDLLIKTLRTRIARLVSEIGTNLSTVLQEL